MKCRAEIEKLTGCVEFILSRAKSEGAPEEVLRQIELASEELLVNIIKYAFVEGTLGEIEVNCDYSEREGLVFHIIDNGAPFDLCGKPDPDTEAPLEERGIGGLGIYLAKQMMDDIRYCRKEDKNILKITKNWELKR